MNRTRSIVQATLVSLLALTGSHGAATALGDTSPPAGSEGGASDRATEVPEPAPRLVVADGHRGAVEIVDLTSGGTISTLETAGVSRLVSDGRFVFAVAGDDDAVSIIDGGAWVVAHGDHLHSFTADAAVVGTVEGPTPVHTISSDGQTVIFFDGDGSAAAFAADDLAAGDVTPALSLASPSPHHGVAVALDDHYLVTVPGATADELPTGVEVRHGAVEVEAQFANDCPELHGEAAFATGVLFACDHGALWVTATDGDWKATTIDWPAAESGEERTWSFAHTDGVPVVAGIAGEGLITIDVDTGAVSRIDAPSDVINIAVVNDGADLFVITRDGIAHLIDADSGEETTAAPVVSRTPDDVAGYQAEAPQIVVVGSRAYVTDAVAGAVVEIATNDDLRVARTFDVELQPGAIAVVGAP